MTHIHAKEQRPWDTEVIAPWRPLLTWTIESNLPRHMSLCMRRNIKYQRLFISVGWNMKHTLNTISRFWGGTVLTSFHQSIMGYNCAKLRHSFVIIQTLCNLSMKLNLKMKESDSFTFSTLPETLFNNGISNFVANLQCLMCFICNVMPIVCTVKVCSAIYTM